MHEFALVDIWVRDLVLEVDLKLPENLDKLALIGIGTHQEASFTRNFNGAEREVVLVRFDLPSKEIRVRIDCCLEMTGESLASHFRMVGILALLSEIYLFILSAHSG